MSEFSKLQELMGIEPDAARVRRIKALSDADLLRYAELLSDETQLRNVAALPELLAECKARGLVPANRNSTR